jgi:TolA-binding protein
VAAPTAPARSFEDKKRADAEARRLKKEADERARRVADLESRIADREREIRELEGRMSAPEFYNVRESAEKAVKRHQELMWEVGDLMNQWESLQ